MSCSRILFFIVIIVIVELLNSCGKMLGIIDDSKYDEPKKNTKVSERNREESLTNKLKDELEDAVVESIDESLNDSRNKKDTSRNRQEYSNWDHGQEVPINDSAEETFRNYYRAITDGNYREAYDTLSNEQKQRMGDFNSYVSGFSTTISGEVIDLCLVSSDEDSRTYDYTVKARDRDRGRIKVSIFKGQVTMAKGRGRWFVRYARSNKTDDWYE